MSCSGFRLASFALVVASALGVENGAQRVSQRGLPRRSRAIAPVVLDFRTEDDLVTPLQNGQAISAGDEFGRLVTISSAGANAGAAIFDTTLGGPNDPSQDVDLLVGLDNVLILQNSLVPGQTTPDVFDRPNDDQDGGELVFDFEIPVEPLSIVLVDIDDGATQGVLVTLTDELARTRTYTVPQRWTRDVVDGGNPGWGNLSLETLAPQPGFLSSATATQHPGFDAAHVVRLVVRLGSSGAVDYLQWRPGRALGMVALDSTDSVLVFDADLDQALGTVFLPPASDEQTTGDCLIDVRRRLGYVTDFRNSVWVIDLAAPFPQLAAGVNPIVISNPGEDLSISPDGRFLAVSDGSAPRPLSIVDLDTRTEVGTVFAPSDCNSIDFAGNETLVGTSINLERLQGFALANDGTPSLTGEQLAFANPNNVGCAPGGFIGVGISRFPAQMRSFQVQGLVQLETQTLSNTGLSVCFAPDGKRLFVRTSASVLAWPFDPLTGDIGGIPAYSFIAGSLLHYYGMERIAVHPDGTRLYVPENGQVRIHDAASGNQVGSIPMFIADPVGGIAVERGLR